MNTTTILEALIPINLSKYWCVLVVFIGKAIGLGEAGSIGLADSFSALLMLLGAIPLLGAFTYSAYLIVITTAIRKA